METMHAAVLTAPRRFELRVFPPALGSHPPRVLRLRSVQAPLDIPRSAQPR